MNCATCPYGKDNFERRMSYDPNNTNCWCDKVGGKTYLWGYCGDAYSNILQRKSSSKKRRSTKRERAEKYKSHLKYLSKISNYPKPAYYIDEIKIKRYQYVENPKPYYKRQYRDKYSPYLKKISNRKIRYYTGDLSNGQHCHKLFDFWWEMY